MFVDFLPICEEALPLVKKYQETGNTDKNLENKIAKILLPIAEVSAKQHACRYKGSQLRGEIDYDNCFSTNLEKLTKAIKQVDLEPDGQARNLLSYILTCFDFGFKDIERKVLTRQRHGLFGGAINDQGTFNSGQKNYEYVRQYEDKTSPRPDEEAHKRDVEESRALQELEAKVLEAITPSDSRVLKAHIDGTSRGLSWTEIAETLDMKVGTYKSTIGRIRKNLKEGGVRSHIGDYVEHVLGEENSTSRAR